jgi:hypothetical protein
MKPHSGKSASGGAGDFTLSPLTSFLVTPISAVVAKRDSSQMTPRTNDRVGVDILGKLVLSDTQAVASHSLAAQQICLDGTAAAIESGEGAIAPDNAVAGHARGHAVDIEGVAAHGRAHGPAGARAADSCGDGRVRGDRTRWDGRDIVVHVAAESRRRRVLREKRAHGTATFCTAPGARRRGGVSWHGGGTRGAARRGRPRASKPRRLSQHASDGGCSKGHGATG